MFKKMSYHARKESKDFFSNKAGGRLARLGGRAYNAEAKEQLRDIGL